MPRYGCRAGDVLCKVSSLRVGKCIGEDEGEEDEKEQGFEVSTSECTGEGGDREIVPAVQAVRRGQNMRVTGVGEREGRQDSPAAKHLAQARSPEGQERRWRRDEGGIARNLGDVYKII